MSQKPGKEDNYRLNKNTRFDRNTIYFVATLIFFPQNLKTGFDLVTPE